MVGTAVLRMVVSSDSMKNATAMSHGSKRRLESASAAGVGGDDGRSMGLVVPTLAGAVGGGMVGRVRWMGGDARRFLTWLAPVEFCCTNFSLSLRRRQFSFWLFIR